jgi:hypothetical protein
MTSPSPRPASHSAIVGIFGLPEAELMAEDFLLDERAGVPAEPRDDPAFDACFEAVVPLDEDLGRVAALLM